MRHCFSFSFFLSPLPTFISAFLALSLSLLSPPTLLIPSALARDFTYLESEPSLPMGRFDGLDTDGNPCSIQIDYDPEVENLTLSIHFQNILYTNIATITPMPTPNLFSFNGDLECRTENPMGSPSEGQTCSLPPLDVVNFDRLVRVTGDLTLTPKKRPESLLFSGVFTPIARPRNYRVKGLCKFD